MLREFVTITWNRSTKQTDIADQLMDLHGDWDICMVQEWSTPDAESPANCTDSLGQLHTVHCAKPCKDHDHVLSGSLRVSSNSGTINSYKSLVIENVALYFYIAAGLIALLKKASNILVVYF